MIRTALASSPTVSASRSKRCTRASSKPVAKAPTPRSSRSWNLPLVNGLAVAASLRRHARALAVTAAVAAASWGLLGLTVLPRRDVAGAVGVPLLLLFLWRSRNRALYASAFLVVAALEFYGTAIGTWRWARTLPGLGVPDGNPPSGVASGYVWFDVMALLVTPLILRALRTRPATGQTLPRSTPA